MAKDKKKSVSKRKINGPTAKDRKLYARKAKRLDELEQALEEAQAEIDEVSKEFDAELGKANKPLLEEMQANAKKYRAAFEAAVGDKKKAQAERIQEAQALNKEIRKLTRKIWDQDADDEDKTGDDGAKVHTLPTADGADDGDDEKSEEQTAKPLSPDELLRKHQASDGE